MARPRRQPRTPEEKAAELTTAAARVRKRYKVNVRTRRKFTFEGEDDIAKDMVVVLKLANYSNSQIGMIVGVSRGQVAEFLSDPNVEKKYMALKEKLPQAALELGRQYLIEAVQAIVHVMRNTQDEALVLKAASELFDRFGIPKVSRNEVKSEASEGEDHPVDQSLLGKLRSASPEVQERAAELQDMFEEGLASLLEAGKDTDGPSD